MTPKDNDTKRDQTTKRPNDKDTKIQRDQKAKRPKDKQKEGGGGRGPLGGEGGACFFKKKRNMTPLWGYDFSKTNNKTNMADPCDRKVSENKKH